MVNVPEKKLAARVAYALSADILKQGWPVGRKLGTEQELLASLAISRGTFREAIRILERQGIVRSERGWNGGLIIQAPALDVASNILRTYLELADVSFIEVRHAQNVIHRFGIARAIACMTPAFANGVRRYLTSVKQDFRSRDHQGQLIGGVYARIIDIAGNPSLSMLNHTLDRVIADFGHQERYPRKLWLEMTTHMWALVRRMGNAAAERQLSEALAAFDEAAEYVDTVVQGLAERNERVWNIRSFLAGSYSSAFIAQKSSDKAAVSLSYHIMAQVRRVGLPAGTRLGSEAQLMAQFQVSRSTLREAIRTLEFFGMVAAQRGAGGGLSVSEPNPSSVIDAAVLYLSYFGLDALGVKALIVHLETEIARLASVGASHHEIVARLAEADAIAKSSAGVESLTQLYRSWSALAGNRALTLLLEILTTVQREANAGIKTVHQRDKSIRSLKSATSTLYKAVVGQSTAVLHKSLESFGTRVREAMLSLE